MHAERLTADLAGQVKRRPGYAVPRQLQGIGGDACLQRLLDFRGRAEEPVRRRQPIGAAMGSLEVVMVDKETDPPLGIAEVEEDGVLDTLAPRRLRLIPLLRGGMHRHRAKSRSSIRLTRSSVGASRFIHAGVGPRTRLWSTSYSATHCA